MTTDPRARAPRRAHRRSRLAAAAWWVTATMLGIAVLGVVLLTLGTVTGWLKIQTVPTGSMEPTIHQGSAIVVDPVAIDDIAVGDVIVFAAPETGRMTVHRVVEVDEQDGQPVFLTKGDANDAPDPWRLVAEDDHFHKVRYAVPGVGRVLLDLSSPWARMALAVAGGAAVLWFGLTHIWRRHPDEHDGTGSRAHDTWGDALARLLEPHGHHHLPGFGHHHRRDDADPLAAIVTVADRHDADTDAGPDSGSGSDELGEAAAERDAERESDGTDDGDRDRTSGGGTAPPTRPAGHPRVRRLATTSSMSVMAVATAIAGLIAAFPAPVAEAAFDNATTAAAATTSLTVAPKGGVGCSWDTETAVSVSWTNPNPVDATQVLMATTPNATPAVVASAPPGTTTAAYSPPNPLTTVRWLSARGTAGTWTSTASPGIATNDCRLAVRLSAGSGSTGYSGDGGPATAARLDTPMQTAEATDGRIFIADSGNDRIRVVAPDGTISTYAGGGFFTYCSYPGPAAWLRLSGPQGVAVDAAGNVYVADTGNDCVRMITPDGWVVPIAGGNGTSNCSATTSASNVSLNAPSGLALAPNGDLIVADTANDCVRRVSGGTIGPVAGGGGSSGCGTTSASGVSLRDPTGVAVDAAGDVYVADTGRRCVRRVSGGTVTAVAGGGNASSCDFSGSAGSVRLSNPEGVAVAANGDVYIADTGRRCLRAVSGGTVSRFAFTGSNSSNGDDGPALGATIRTPSMLTLLADGDLLVSDRATNNGSNDVRRIELS